MGAVIHILVAVWQLWRVDMRGENHGLCVKLEQVFTINHIPVYCMYTTKVRG